MEEIAPIGSHTCQALLEADPEPIIFYRLLYRYKYVIRGLPLEDNRLRKNLKPFCLSTSTIYGKPQHSPPDRKTDLSGLSLTKNLLNWHAYYTIKEPLQRM